MNISEGRLANKMGGMLVDMLFHIKTINEEYEARTLKPDDRPIMIGDLCDLISEYEDCKIKVISAHLGGKKTAALNGKFVRRNDEYLIFVDSRLNYCYSRYIAAKEMCHVFSFPDAALPGGKVGDFVTAMATVGDRFVPPETDMEIEQNVDKFAELVGGLLLFPINDMRLALKQLEAGTTTHYKIAEKYRIPEAQVFWLLNDHVQEFLNTTFATMDAVLE